MGLLTATATLKLGESALKLVGAAAKAAGRGELADLFNLAGGTVAFTSGLTEAHRATVSNTIAKVQKRLEYGYQMMLAREGADWALRADVQAVFLGLTDVLGAALPDVPAVVAANLDTARVAALVADKAAIVDPLFAKDQIGGRILVELLTAAYDVVKQDPRFTGALTVPIAQELLERTEGIARIESLLTSRIAAETGVPLALLNEILTRFGDNEAARDPSQVEARLRAKALEYQELRRRLCRLTADDPRVQALRRKAGELVEAGSFEEADSELAKAERLDLEVGRELQVHTERRFASAAASRSERAAAARLRLDYRTAAAHFAEAASIVGQHTDAAWGYLVKQAEALFSQGHEFGDNPALHEGLVVCGVALHLVPRDQMPLRWATTQMNIGNTLAILGERENTSYLMRAVVAYRGALQELTRDPPAWALTKMNLGNALRTLGALAGETTLLEQAVVAYRAALTERTHDKIPLDWAITQMNLAIGLRTLGERAGGMKYLRDAVAALEEITRDDASYQWTSVQINLGNALMTLGKFEVTLGKFEDGTADLEKAVAVFQDVLKELTRALAPMRWATTKMNLGAALQTLGERKGGTTFLKQAVEACNDALQELTPSRAAPQWAAAQINLGNALKTLGEREGGTVFLKQAVAAYDAALTVLVSAQNNHLADICRNNRRQAIALLSKRME